MHNKFKYLNDDTEFLIDDKVVIGENVTFGKNCRKIKIGYGSFLGDNIYIDLPELTIGEYTTLHRGTTIHGYKSCSIGHNCWIGQFCIIDSIGGTTIGNNVGIGANSQLWSHMKFGDVLEGCLWNSTGTLIVEDDVWFVGHCIVSPIKAEAKSMLLAGSVATKDLKSNHIYAGSPAKDISDKLGPQFKNVSLNEKIHNFQKLCESFKKNFSIDEKHFKVEVYYEFNEFDVKDYDDSALVFFLKDRKYIPNRSDIEYKFMKYLLYDKAKFLPILN